MREQQQLDQLSMPRNPQLQQNISQTHPDSIASTMSTHNTHNTTPPSSPQPPLASNESAPSHAVSEVSDTPSEVALDEFEDSAFPSYAEWVETLNSTEGDLSSADAPLESETDSFMFEMDPFDEMQPQNKHSAGDGVGEYEIIEVLGSGVFGDVYRARRVYEDGKDRNDSDPRDVALKIIQPTTESQTIEQIYQGSEFRAFRRCGHHENVISLYDVFKHGAETVFVLQLVRGRDLHQILSEHPQGVGLEVAVHVALQVCDALAHLHSKGIAHRDAKASNIMLEFPTASQDLSNAKVRLVDLGQAVLWDIDDPTTNTTSVVQQTPYDASSELMSESSEPTPVQKDIQNLGIVLYEMICGERPPWPQDERERFSEAGWVRASSDLQTLVAACLGEAHSRPELGYIKSQLEREASN